MIEDMDSNETKVCPIKIALEINWVVESDSSDSKLIGHERDRKSVV